MALNEPTSYLLMRFLSYVVYCLIKCKPGHMLFEKQKQLRWLFQIHSPSKCAVVKTHGYSSSRLENCNECCRFGDKLNLFYYTIT